MFVHGRRTLYCLSYYLMSAGLHLDACFVSPLHAGISGISLAQRKLLQVLGKFMAKKSTKFQT